MDVNHFGKFCVELSDEVRALDLQESKKMCTRRMFYVVGNIGSGKSSLLGSLERAFGGVCGGSDESKSRKTVCVPEPLDKFTSYKEKFNPLKLYYANPYKNAFFFQLYLLDCFCESYKNAINNSYSGCNIFVESGFVASRYFVHHGYAKGYYTDVQYTYLLDKIDLAENDVLSSHPDVKLSGLVVVTTDLETCLKRITLRDRKIEKDFPNLSSYLSDLQTHIDVVCRTSSVPVFRWESKVSFALNIANLKRGLLSCQNADTNSRPCC